MNARLLRSFGAEVWGEMEQKWLSLGGKPHYGKYYGLKKTGEQWSCFDPSGGHDTKCTSTRLTALHGQSLATSCRKRTRSAC